MKTFIFLIFALPAFLFYGCGTSFKTQYFGVEDEAIFVPKEFAQTIEAVEKAKSVARSEYQYRKIEEAMEQGRLAAVTYWECNDGEAKALLGLARQSAYRAEMYHPEPPPPTTGRTLSTLDPPVPAEILLPETPFSGARTASPAMILGTVYFPFDSAAFVPSDPERFRSRILGMPDDIEYEVSGHTDSVGDPSYNHRLSERRARAFKAYLEKQGISPQKMISVGYGESYPVSSNSTEAGRDKNRRAEIRVVPPVFAPSEPPRYAALPAGTTIEVIHFNFASNRLPGSQKSALDQIVEVLNRNPDLKLEIAGYSDNTGGADANRRLSGRRAQVVADHLIASGLDAGRLTLRAYGEADPFASNDTIQGRSLNRRVEIKIHKATDSPGPSGQ